MIVCAGWWLLDCVWPGLIVLAIGVAVLWVLKRVVGGR